MEDKEITSHEFKNELILLVQNCNGLNKDTVKRKVSKLWIPKGKMVYVSVKTDAR